MRPCLWRSSPASHTWLCFWEIPFRFPPARSNASISSFITNMASDSPSGSAGEQLPELRALSFAGRSAIVTGGARGIGRAVAYRLACLGADVALWDIDEPAAQATAKALATAVATTGESGTVVARRVDITDSAAIEHGLEAFCPSGLDVLVNNAGMTSIEPIGEMTVETWERFLRLNLTGAFLCIRAAIPYLRRRPEPAVATIS